MMLKPSFMKIGYLVTCRQGTQQQITDRILKILCLQNPKNGYVLMQHMEHISVLVHVHMSPAH